MGISWFDIYQNGHYLELHFSDGDSEDTVLTVWLNPAFLKDWYMREIELKFTKTSTEVQGLRTVVAQGSCTHQSLWKAC